MQSIYHGQDKNPGHIIQEPMQIPVLDRADVVVAGGGVAGIGAAVAAARLGAKTVLIERNGVVGGAATSGLVAEFGGQGGYGNVSGIAREIIDELISMKAATPGRFRCSFNPEYFKYVALTKLLDAGADVMLYTSVLDVIRTENRIEGLIIETKTGRRAITSSVAIDCTGDGDLVFRAGAEYVTGRESDGKMRPIGLMFRIGNIDVPEMMEYCRSHPEDFVPDPSKNIMDMNTEYPAFRPMGFFSFIGEGKKAGRLPPDCHYLRFDSVDVDKGVLTVNNVRVYNVDGTVERDLLRADLEARQQMFALFHFIKDVIPGCGNAFLIDSGANLGIRETRRLVGEYVLTEDDIVGKVVFPDCIGKIGLRSAPRVEVHSPDAGECAEDDIHYRKYIDDLHMIAVPFRSLLPKRIDGLLAAGRCISADHQADGWTRVEPVCFVTGQAAGTAAALSAQQKIPVRNIDTHRIREILIREKVSV